MTDQELLESAAKAMGFTQHHSYREKLNALLWLSESGYPSTWSPLTDDKDAFQLAVDMKMNLNLLGWRSEAQVSDHPVVVEQVVNNDAYAATRKAIVRAAAETVRGQE
jgi:hypothetical protein